MKTMAHKALFWFVPAVAVAALASAQVWLSHLRYETSQDTQKLLAEKKDAAAEVTRLNLEVASLTRPERLRQIAGTSLGMQPPHPMQVIRP